jgi:hypothetical protein
MGCIRKVVFAQSRNGAEVVPEGEVFVWAGPASGSAKAGYDFNCANCFLISPASL